MQAESSADTLTWALPTLVALAPPTAIKALTDEQRKALLVVRNQRGLYSYRQLLESIYDKVTNTVPADALADLIAKGRTTANASTSGGSTSTPSGGSTSGFFVCLTWTVRE